MHRPDLRRLLTAVGFILSFALPLHSRADVTVEDLPLDPAPAVTSASAPDSTDAASVPAPTPAPQSNSLDEKTWIRLQTMDNENRQLRGQLEEQAHEIQLLKQQIKLQYTNMDQRLSTMESTVTRLSTTGNPATSAASAETAPGAAPPDATTVDMEKQAYLAAYQVYRDKGPDVAIPGMLEFVHQYPKSVFLPHAEYWLGEFYLNKQIPDLKKAAGYFETVVTQYPKHAKAPAALYNLAMIDASIKKKALAIATLHKLISAYPDCAQVKLAQEWLSKQSNKKKTPKMSPDDEAFLKKVQTALDQFN